MSRYTLELSKSAHKFLSKSDMATRKRIIHALHALVEEPHNYSKSIKLKGLNDVYRIRVGKFRVIYKILDDKLIVFIQNIDSRGDVYKRF